MKAIPVFSAALKQCNPARADVIISMVFQLGVNGLAKFESPLKMIEIPVPPQPREAGEEQDKRDRTVRDATDTTLRQLVAAAAPFGTD